MAMKGFSAGTYDVPADWTGVNSTVRYRVVMVFCLPPSNQATTFTESPYAPIIIAGSRIGHLPVQTVPGTCKARQYNPRSRAEQWIRSDGGAFLTAPKI